MSKKITLIWLYHTLIWINHVFCLAWWVGCRRNLNLFAWAQIWIYHVFFRMGSIFRKNISPCFCHDTNVNLALFPSMFAILVTLPWCSNLHALDVEQLLEDPSLDLKLLDVARSVQTRKYRFLKKVFLVFFLYIKWLKYIYCHMFIQYSY